MGVHVKDAADFASALLQAAQPHRSEWRMVTLDGTIENQAPGKLHTNRHAYARRTMPHHATPFTREEIDPTRARYSHGLRPTRLRYNMAK